MSRNIVTHLIWIIVVLIMVISVLLWRLPNGNNLSSYISFAASLASLVLAAVAIFQSILSSSAFAKSISDIQNSASKIVEETSKLNDATVSLSTETENTIQRLAELPEKISDWKSEIFEQLNQIQSSNFDEESSSQSSLGDKEFSIKSKTLGFALTIYITVLSNKNNKFIDLDEIFPNSEFIIPRNYANGVLSTLKYFSIGGLTIEGIAGTFQIVSLGQWDADKIINSIRKEKYKSKLVVDSINLVNSFFEQTWKAELQDSNSGEQPDGE